MQKVFIHLAPGPIRGKPTSLVAVTPDRSLLFESAISWVGMPAPSNEIARRLAHGSSEATTNWSYAEAHGTFTKVIETFRDWEQANFDGIVEYWAMSLQDSWPDINAVGLNMSPIFDMGTLLRVSGLSYGDEWNSAWKHAASLCGAGSARCGAYAATIVYQTLLGKGVLKHTIK